MPEPLFDRVEEFELPEHLQGKTPKEVGQYFAQREQQIRQEAANANQPQPTTIPQPASTVVTAATPSGMTAGQFYTLREGAKIVAREGKEHWQRFLPEVEAIMANMQPVNQTDANMWSTVYEKVVGLHVNDLVKEARDAALRPPSMESSAASTQESAPRQLTANEQHVVEGFRRAGAVTLRDGKEVPFDSTAYLAADKKAKDGTWPLTFNTQY